MSLLRVTYRVVFTLAVRTVKAKEVGSHNAYRFVCTLTRTPLRSVLAGETKR